MVISWIDRLPEESERVAAVITRRIAQDLSRWERIDHYTFALGWITQKILLGYTLEEILSSWEHSGGYLMNIGIGHGISWEGRLSKPPTRGDIGVYIHGRGLKLFPTRKMWKEAQALLDSRRRGQAKLFKA